MKLNPQAIINSGLVGGGCSGSNIGTQTPVGIQNNHRFENEGERDAYFTTNFAELVRLKTIIVCGGKLQLWTGKSAPNPYDNTKWVDMTWVIQGEEGTPGEKGDPGRGIAKMEPIISPDEQHWNIKITYTDATIEELMFPVPQVVAGIGGRVAALETRWISTTPIPNLNSAITQGRYYIGDNTLNKPPMLTTNQGAVDVYAVGNSIIQVVRSLSGSAYSRARLGDAWGNWVSAGGGGGAGGLNPDQEALLLSLGNRLPEKSPEAEDLNTKTTQGRYCYGEATRNRPNDQQPHGSVDVHACRTHVLQVATSIEGIIYHRSQSVADGVWTDWKAVSDQSGGATLHPFPRVSSVFTTMHGLISPNVSPFYIPWKYVIHDNYGCTPRITAPNRQDDADHWWVCPKSGSYQMSAYIAVSYVKTAASIPTMVIAKAFRRSVGSSDDVLMATYEIPTDTVNRNQKTFEAKLELGHFPQNDMIRWQITLVGGSWTDQDNPDAAFVPFRTMLIVDETGFDTAKRVASLAHSTWANFHAKKGLAATVLEDSDQKARVNGVKWNATIETVNAKVQGG